MSNSHQFDAPGMYQIRVKGTLDEKWSDWFDGFAITCHPDDETLLVGLARDQAALHGMLSKIRALGLPLLTVQRVSPDVPKGEKHEERVG